MNQEKVWDEIARPWSEFRTKVSPTVEKFVKSQKGRILDVGCGSGRNFIKVKGLEWYAIDFSREMIKMSDEEAKRKKMQVNLVKAKSEDLPFDEGFFDSVLCFAVIHCVDSKAKRKKTIEEIFRVLRPGGQALIASWGPRSPRLKNKDKESFVPWTVREGEGKQMRYTYIFDLDELKELCEAAGFEVVSAWEERNVNVIVRKPE
jgi:ubiquinone/menaquinone biosynthesis C-methylase UbiE